MAFGCNSDRGNRLPRPDKPSANLRLLAPEIAVENGRRSKRTCSRGREMENPLRRALRKAGGHHENAARTYRAAAGTPNGEAKVEGFRKSPAVSWGSFCTDFPQRRKS